MEEENQNTNSEEQFNISNQNQPENKKKKKGMGPLKGLLVALLLAIIICGIGLLVRMLVVGDGDYFQPIKYIFGVEDEEKEEKKTKKSKDEKEDIKKEEKSNAGDTKDVSSARYQLLSDDVEDSDVKHYRLTIDMKKFFKQFMKELNNDDSSLYSNEMGGMEDMIGMAMMMLSQMSDYIDGEMYFDIYFEGNEIIQIIIGYDYADLLKNLYEYFKEESEEDFETEGIDSLEDFADYMTETFEELLNEDTLYDTLMSEAGEDVETALAQFGIKEKDIKDAIDFNVDTGLIEFYINGTTKLKGLISMALDSEGFQNEIEAMKGQTDVKIDKDNIIESVLLAANESDEYSSFGFEFVEVK